MQMPDGRRFVWGWVNGFPAGRGWNGCLSLPRQLSLSSDENLLQSPAPELAKLRGQPLKWQNIHLQDGNETFALLQTNTLEILAEIDLQAAKSIVLNLHDEKSDSPLIVIHVNGSELQVLDTTAPLLLKPDAKKLTLHIFIDRSVLEVFANDTVCITKIIPQFGFNDSLKVRVEGGATIKHLEVWPIKTIW